MSEPLLNDPILRDLPVNAGWKVIGPVVLEKKLGQGGMGAVYRGRHLRLNCPVAVKLMSHHLAANATQFAERFRREAQVAVSLNHPNLVRCFDVNTEYGVNYMILEFIQGEDAGQRVKRKGRPGLAELEACAIIASAAAGLTEAHRRNIVHRDIKPENIMVDHTGRVVLMDLGLAKIVEDPGEAMTVTGQAMGTPNYMSPEQWDDAKSAGLASDIWALGVSLYTLATGRLPWAASGMGLLMKKVQNDAMDDPRGHVPALSDRFVALIDRCLKKHPSDRISAADLHRELRQITGDNFDLTDPAVSAAIDTGSIPNYPSPSSLSQQAASASSAPNPSAATNDDRTVQLEPAYPRGSGSTDPTLIAPAVKIPQPARPDVEQAWRQHGSRIPSAPQIEALAEQMSRKHRRTIEPRQVLSWLKTVDAEARAAGRGGDDLQPGPASEWGQRDLSGLIDDLVRQRVAEATDRASRETSAVKNVVQARLREALPQRLSPAEESLADELIRTKVDTALREAGPPKPGCLLMGLHPVIHLPIVMFLGLIYMVIPLSAEKSEGIPILLWIMSAVMFVPNLLGVIGGIMFRTRFGPSALRLWATLLLILTLWLLLASGCLMTFLSWEEIQ